MIAAILLLVAIALVVWAICESLDDNADDFDQHADEADPMAIADDLRGDFDWPPGFPVCGDQLAADLAATCAPFLFAEIEREVGIA